MRRAQHCFNSPFLADAISFLVVIDRWANAEYFFLGLFIEALVRSDLPMVEVKKGTR